MVVGYQLRAPDNDSYMLRPEADWPRCDACGVPTDRDWIDPLFLLEESGADVSYTYDHYLIVSERFRAAASRSGARFIPLPSVSGFFAMATDSVVAFDARRRQTVFEDYCPTCGRFTSVAGAKPAYLKVTRPLSAGFFRTDVEFGSQRELSPLFIAGPGLAEHLDAVRLVGLDWAPAYGADES